MDKYKLHVLIVPTAGWDNRKRMPTENGLRRLERAVRLADMGETQAVLIMGGKRQTGPSEAQLYHEFAILRMRFRAEIFKRTIWRWDAPAAYTQKDMATCNNAIETLLHQIDYIANFRTETHRIGIISYPDHAKRVAQALDPANREIIIVNSLERPMYPSWMEKLLTWMTDRDPRWEHFPAIIFAWIANCRQFQTLLEPVQK